MIKSLFTKYFVVNMLNNKTGAAYSSYAAIFLIWWHESIFRPFWCFLTLKSENYSLNDAHFPPPLIKKRSVKLL